MQSNNIKRYQFQEISGTLRGPNKPLPPTPTDSSPMEEDHPEEHGTLLGRNSGNGQPRHMVKAASMPDTAPVVVPAQFGVGGFLINRYYVVCCVLQILVLHCISSCSVVLKFENF